jgi:hypothetical protein
MEVAERYPVRFHIDMLPSAKGAGFASQLIENFTVESEVGRILMSAETTLGQLQFTTTRVTR